MVMSIKYQKMNWMKAWLFFHYYELINKDLDLQMNRLAIAIGKFNTSIDEVFSEIFLS